MNVPLLDLKAQYETIREEIRQAIDRVCESQHFILGPEVQKFEEEVAAFCGARFAIGMSSGTDALLASLIAIGVGPGDEVITTTYSFFATAGVIARCRATPVFIDIDPETFTIDSNAVAAKVTPRTKAIIPVHLFGRCADMDPILEVAKKSSLYVIEDAAQAIGSYDEKGRQAGTIGDMGCFSFFPSKNLGAFGDGGMVVTNDEKLAEALRTLRVHGGKPKYYHGMIGGNFRLDAMQAAIVRVKLKYLKSWTERRRRNAKRYREHFESAMLLDIARLPEDCEGHTYNQFVIRLPNRDRLRRILKSQGIETEVYYPVPLHLQDCFQNLGYRNGQFSEAESASLESLALPIYPELTTEQQYHIAEHIKGYYHQ